MSHYAPSANAGAFLDMIAWSEIGVELLSKTDDGYNVIVGSTPDMPITFGSYSRHPGVIVSLNEGLRSSAAGRYQLLERYFHAYAGMLHLPDFSPESQDKIALQQIQERHALAMLASGDVQGAITACSNIWASLPGNNYGQHQNAMDRLIEVYRQKGGKTDKEG